MSLDRSLKSGSGLGRHRNVLTRAERIEKLASVGKWKDGEPVTGLVKVGNRKVLLGGKADKKADAAAADPKAAPAAKGAKAAPAGKAAPAAKAAAPKK